MATPPKPPPPKSEDVWGGLQAATADLDNLSLVDLDDEAPAVRAESPDPGARDLEPAANLEIALDRDARTGRAKPPSTDPGPSPTAESGLQLDFSAAGLSAPIKGQSAPMAPTVSAPAPAPVVQPLAAPVRPLRRGLFGSDPVTRFLIAGAIGLLLGVYPALQSARSRVGDATREGLAELNESVDRPLAVRAGDLRSPAEITAQIEREYGPARSRFWLVWLGIALPVAITLGAIRRRA